MRKLLTLISAAGLALALATSASALPFNGQFSFALSTLPGLTGSGTGSSVSTAGLVTLPATPFGSAAATGANKITLAATAAAPLSAISAVLLAPANCSFTAAGGGGGGFGGPCGLGGTINALVASAPFLVVPASGLGGTARVAFGPYLSYIDPQPWTTGVATITINGVALTTGNATSPGVNITMAGSDLRTPGGAGVITLVAPAGLMSTLGGAFPLFVSMTLTFVPEPGTLLLLGSGIAGLAILGRKRMRS